MHKIWAVGRASHNPVIIWNHCHWRFDFEIGLRGWIAERESNERNTWSGKILSISSKHHYHHLMLSFGVYYNFPPSGNPCIKVPCWCSAVLIVHGSLVWFMMAIFGPRYQWPAPNSTRFTRWCKSTTWHYVRSGNLMINFVFWVGRLEFRIRFQIFEFRKPMNIMAMEEFSI